jgi:hypothetical protein
MYLYLESAQWFKTIESVVKTVQDGLKQTGRMSAWELEWPRKSVSSVSPFVERKAEFDVAVELVNEKGKVIGRQKVRFPYGWTVSNAGFLRVTPVNNENYYRRGVYFSAVKVDDITDSLEISVASIDGEKAQSASENKRISIVTFDKYTKKDNLFKVGNTGPGGGIIFYDKGNYSGGWRYLEVAQRDAGKASWGLGGLYRKNVKGTETSVGSGKKNTELILAKLKASGETRKAAQLCEAFTSNGYKDWFLPSRDELYLIYNNFKASQLFDKPDWFWSSSQADFDAWSLDFHTGKLWDYSKNYPFSVRAVRAF